jgi:branched-chain amino acid transport system ATP-binding protein
MALLEVSRLVKQFGGLIAVQDSNFVVNQGEILGLIGPNGAGKTTIFNLITGFLQPDRGTIIFDGTEIQGFKPHEISRRGLARTFQTAQSFLHMSTLQNVMVGGFIHTRNADKVRKEALEILDFTGLTSQKDKEAENLTIGDSRRLEIAKALAIRPSLILLDEVMAGLNLTEIEEAIEIIQKIRSRGITVFMVEHVMHAIMTLSDRIIVVNYGKMIAEGRPEQVAENREVIEAYLGREYVME